MQAVVLTDSGIALQEMPSPELVSGEAVVAVELAGICSTDLELAKGYMDFHGILGHEFVGRVTECHDEAWLGRRVVAGINIAPPDTTDTGLLSEHRHTPGRSVLGILNRHGAMAEQVAVPIENLVQVPDAVPNETAVFAEPLAAALRISEQLNLGNQNVAVIGPGRLGMLIAATLHQADCNVTLFGRSEASLRLGRQWGIPTCHSDAPPKTAFDAVVEATGSPAGLELGLRLVRPLGRLILKSTYAHPPAVDLSPIVVNEINVIGSRCGSMHAAVRKLQEETIDTDSLIDARYPLSQALESFDVAARAGIRKVLLDIGTG
ncbi:MAG TPA: alcohol dehydrogenase [Planctomycetaceae bacterium]|nr:alcohol dehydrogenase [Planctomycetaceae bacterium]